jgi:hypothetical protein
MASRSSRLNRTARQLFYVLKYASSGALLVGFLIFLVLNLFGPAVSGSSSYGSADGGTAILSFQGSTLENGRSGVTLSFAWMGIYIGFLTGWALGWHRLKERKASFRWPPYNAKEMRLK